MTATPEGRSETSILTGKFAAERRKRLEQDAILLERSKGIGLLTFNRPEKLNAMNLPQSLPYAFAKAINEVESDDTIRVLVITGAGRGFCAGADVNDLQRIYGESPEYVRNLNQGIDRAIYKLATMPKPTVAAVNGPAVGAGACIALACDLIIASTEARFGWVFIERGISPAEMGAGYLLPRRVGLGRALELFYTGKIIDAGEAERIGLANRVVEAEQLREASMKLAGELSERPPLALAMCKTAVFKGLSTDLSTEMEIELFAETLTMLTDDHRRGIEAFLARRTKS